MWSIRESCWKLNPTEYNELFQGKRVCMIVICVKLKTKYFTLMSVFLVHFRWIQYQRIRHRCLYSFYQWRHLWNLECESWPIYMIFTVVTLFQNTGWFYFWSIGFQTARNYLFGSEIFLCIMLFCSWFLSPFGDKCDNSIFLGIRYFSM